MSDLAELAQAGDTVWRGRRDAGEAGDTRRLFDIVGGPATPRTPGVPVLLGFCCDAGVLRNQGRPGAAGGPREIRRALAGVPAHGIGRLVDGGDIHCEGDALEDAQQRLGQAVAAELAVGAWPLVLGGGHEVAWGTWQGLRTHLDAHGDRGRVLVVNLDAHFDLRGSRPASSGTPFDQIAIDCQRRGLRFDYACLGVSRLGNTAALFARASTLGVRYVEDVDLQERHLDARLAALDEWVAEADHVYLTIDLDVLPAAVMPGVSAPAAYGVPLPVVEAIATRLRDSGKLRVADIAEFNPLYDRDGFGARVAARLCYRLLGG
ncbi:formimidoylglutamase [Cupriavidus taiwanensis]|uniref:Formimidoylglutamase n=1 Tax=Cupriavidus taiwanensis TaxID=164546 RepID=A0A375IER5_9BURK|nr:formimidoylglutamase [Cupriavidus taiwanensis]SOZ25084.1 Formimidoylglutamase [Cupriavidus taiwanensis]SPA30526.1 Formimidoylglutamase [Cupriavidus taiwanensis]SPA46606.1 Formimidoylglutamase [Cupriavidus taiwanensis]SPK73286.1 Formimidoylglutamase [Cupriavidus taiwanensis]